MSKPSATVVSIVVRSICVFVLVAFGSQAPAVFAHDFWLEPQEYQISGDDIMLVDIRNGENFTGRILPFSSSAFKRFLVVGKNGTHSVVSAQGDRPAMRQAPLDSNLQVISYESRPSTLVHQTFEDFAKFTREEGIDWVLKGYSDSASNQGPIKERFMRFAKALVSVDSNGGSDELTGMELELVATDDPYQKHDFERISVQLLYRQQPLQGIPVTVHQRRVDGSNIKHTLLTDEQGKVLVPQESGSVYLVNAVHIRKPGALQRFLTHTDWETLWASLTFQSS